VQGNIPQESKWQLEWRDKTVDIYRELSRKEWGRDLVIWPEAAIPMFYHEAIDVLKEMQENALVSHSAFVTGIPYMEVNDRKQEFHIYNSILAKAKAAGCTTNNASCLLVNTFPWKPGCAAPCLFSTCR